MSSSQSWLARPRNVHNATGLCDQLKSAVPGSQVLCIGQIHNNGLQIHIVPGAHTAGHIRCLEQVCNGLNYDSEWYNNEHGTTVLFVWKRRSHSRWILIIFLALVFFNVIDVHKIYASGLGQPWYRQFGRHLGL